MTDGQIGTFKLQQEIDFPGTGSSDTTLTIGDAGGGTAVGGVNLGFDLSSDGASTLEAGGAASVTGTNIINIAIAGDSLTDGGEYSLITAQSGLDQGSFTFVGGSTTTTVTVGDNIYFLTLGQSATALTVTVSLFAADAAYEPNELIQTASLGGTVNGTTTALTWSTNEDLPANFIAAPVSSCFSTPATTTFGQIVFFGALIAPSAGESAPTGWVDFYNVVNGVSTEIGQVMVDSHGFAEFRTAALSITPSGATDAIEAVYGGDANNAPSQSAVSVTVVDNQTVLYVEPNGGSDTTSTGVLNMGTSIDDPLQTLQAAFSRIKSYYQYAGATIYMVNPSGGSLTFDPDDPNGLPSSSGAWLGDNWLSGVAGHPITITAYPGTSVTWDFEQQGLSWSTDSSVFNDYWVTNLIGTYAASGGAGVYVIDPNGYADPEATTWTNFENTAGPISYYDGTDLFYKPDPNASPSGPANWHVASDNSALGLEGHYISVLGITVEYASKGLGLAAANSAYENDTFVSCRIAIGTGDYDNLIQGNYIVKSGSIGSTTAPAVYLSGSNFTVSNNFVGLTAGADPANQLYSGDINGLSGSLIANNVTFENSGNAGVYLEGSGNRITGLVSVDDGVGIQLEAYQWANQIDHCYIEGQGGISAAGSALPGELGFQITDNTINLTSNLTSSTGGYLSDSGPLPGSPVVNDNTYLGIPNWSLDYTGISQINSYDFGTYKSDLTRAELDWDGNSRFGGNAGSFDANGLLAEMENNPTWYGAADVLRNYAAAVVGAGDGVAVTEGTLTPPDATEGVSFTQTVFHFCDADSSDSIAAFSALVTLGDGNKVTLTSSPSANGQIVANTSGGYDVVLTYTYANYILATAGASFGVAVTGNSGTTSAIANDFSVRASLKWNGGNGGNWTNDATVKNWTDTVTGASTAWIPGSVAVFPSTTSPVAIWVSGALWQSGGTPQYYCPSVASMTFQGSGGYTITPSTGGALAMFLPQTTIVVAAAGSASLPSISAGGTLVVTGHGALTLTGADNSWCGDTDIEGATLELSNGSDLPYQSTVYIAAGSTLKTSGNVDIGTLAGTGYLLVNSGNLVLHANASSVFSGSILFGFSTGSGYPGEVGHLGIGALTLTGPISGPGGVAQGWTAPSTPGTLTVTGHGTYTWGTVVYAGTMVVNGTITGTVQVGVGDVDGAELDVNSSLALGGSTNVTLDDGTLVALSNCAIYQPIYASAGNANEIDTDDNTLFFAGTLTGSVDVTGGGKAYFEFGGSVWSNDGTSYFLSPTATYSGSTFEPAAGLSGLVVVNNGATLTLTGGGTAAPDVLEVIEGTVTYSGGSAPTVNAAIVSLDNGTIAAPIGPDATVVSNGDDALTATVNAPVISINDGAILSLSGAGGDASSAAVSLNASELHLAAANSTVQSLSGDSSSSISYIGTVFGTLTVSNTTGPSNAANFAGTIQNSTAALTVVIAGAQQFTGVNTYTGDTEVASGGELAINSDAALGNVGMLTLDGGSALEALDYFMLFSNRTINVPSGATATIDTEGFNLWIASDVTGGGSVNVIGGGNAVFENGPAYTPDQIRTAYGINDLSWDGSGQTIAIVDAYDDPNIFQALDTFDSQFGLADSGPTLYDQYGPTSSFLTVLNQDGQTSPLPGTDPQSQDGNNWEVEEELDVEWAHAIAPGAQIVLVEANCQSLANLMTATATAAAQPGVSVVSMSWGFTEGQGVSAAQEATYDPTFVVPGVTFVASTGDYGAAAPVYPAFSPNVLAVGGTGLLLNADNSYASETGWGYFSGTADAYIGSGGGLSQFETEPGFQQRVQPTGMRTAPDVAFVAGPATGAWVADPYNLDLSDPWEVVGGTSLSAPCWAGLVALVNQGLAANGAAALNASSPTETQQSLYNLSQNDFHAITSGSNGYAAMAGYNLVTGLGTPVANLLVPDLIAGNFPSTGLVAPISPDALVDSEPAGSGGNGGENVMTEFNVFTALTGAGNSDRSPSMPADLPAGAGLSATASQTAGDAVFASYWPEFGLLNSPSNATLARRAAAGALAALESEWATSNQNKQADTALLAIDKVLAEYGV
jgi:hypothetical protein